jgi:GNAT superfamily N-acetyltransferase
MMKELSSREASCGSSTTLRIWWSHTPTDSRAPDAAASLASPRTRSSSERELGSRSIRVAQRLGMTAPGTDVSLDAPASFEKPRGQTLRLRVVKPITVREARRGDEEALARIHAEVARYYLDLAPDYFQVLERFAEPLVTEAPAIESATLHLVAVAEGQVVGALVARLLAPEAATKREITPELGATSLRIEYLAVAAAFRRQGVGTRLVEAAEAWGREAGATVAETTTYQGSPLSLPFWGERMRYEELSVNLRKPL